MRERITIVAEFVYNYLMKTGRAHSDEPWGPKYRWKHTLRVAHWACILAKEEKLDIEKSVIAALFHDVSHFVTEDYRKHGEKSAEIAKSFMHKVGFTKDSTKDICYAVKSHVGERNPRTINAKILQDADTLDRFGYFRILLFGKTTDLSDLKKVKTDILSSMEYLKKVERGDFGPMWTKTGKEKIGELIRVNKTVYRGILSEIKNTGNLRDRA